MLNSLIHITFGFPTGGRNYPIPNLPPKGIGSMGKSDFYLGHKKEESESLKCRF